MNNYLRFTGFIVLALSMLAPAVKAQAEITTVSDAINKAGRQRMLTQRIIKDFCLIGQGVASEAARKELKKSTSLFDSQLKELKAFTPTKKIKERVSRVDMEWGPFLKMADGKSNKETCRTLNEAGEDLLRDSHKIVLALTDFSGSSGGKIINTSGRQRMLSQRIAKYQTMYAWGLADAEIMDSLNRATIEFKGAQVILFQSKLNTPEIRELLIQVSHSYKPLKNVVGLKKDKASLAKVIKNTELILRDMNKATGLYQEVTESM